MTRPNCGECNDTAQNSQFQSHKPLFDFQEAKAPALEGLCEAKSSVVSLAVQVASAHTQTFHGGFIRVECPRASRTSSSERLTLLFIIGQLEFL